MYKNSYNNFTAKHNNNYLSESVLLLTNYIWSRGQKTVQVSNGVEIDAGITADVQKEVKDSNLDSALVHIIQNFVFHGIAFFGYTKYKKKHHILVYHNNNIRYRRNELDVIDTIDMVQNVTVKEVRKMYEDYGEKYSHNYGELVNLYYHNHTGWRDAEVVRVRRSITNNKDMVNEIFAQLGDEESKHYVRNAEWFTITRWGDHIFNVETHSKRPIYWVEYPIRGCDDEPISISAEAEVIGKRLEHAKSLLHESIHMTARPPLLIINDSMVEMGELSIFPDGITVLDTGVGAGSPTGDIRKLYDQSNATQLLMQYVQMLEEKLKRLYGLDRLALPVTSTPAETAALQATRAMYMKSVADSIYKYVLNPLIYRMTSLEDDGGNILEYNSAAANDADKLDLEKNTFLIQFAANLAQFDPAAADVIKPTEMMESVAKTLNISTDVINSEEDLRRIAAIRMQQQALSQQIQNASNGTNNNGA